jgi:GT2 family glycosyltransferase
MHATVVVVNYNAGHWLGDSVTAVLESARVDKVLVIDNASSDDSLAQLQQALGEHPRLAIIRNQQNRSFAGGVNQGLALVPETSAAVLVLNPDCIIHAPALELLLAELQANSRAGLVAPLVHGDNGQVEQAAYRRFPSPRRAVMNSVGLWRWSARWPALAGVSIPVSQWPQSTAAAEAVSGACMLFRRAALLEAGGLDEAYRLHCEDIDIMWRLQDAGWQCLLVPAAKARHRQGVSSSSRRFWVHRQKHLSMLRFFDQHQGLGSRGISRLLVSAAVHLRCILLLPLAWVRR